MVVALVALLVALGGGAYGPGASILNWDEAASATPTPTNEGRSTSINAPPGTVTAPFPMAAGTATPGGSSANHNSQIVELAPERGYLNLHITASTQNTTQICHVSVMSFPAG
jgi:hypothetical protein